MALIECIECGGKISDMASACPHCGYKPSAQTSESDYNNSEFEEPTYNMLQKLLVQHIPYSAKARRFTDFLHYLFVLILIIEIIFSIVTAFTTKSIWMLLFIIIFYAIFYLSELSLGLVGMFIDMCDDIKKLANKN